MTSSDSPLHTGEIMDTKCGQIRGVQRDGLLVYLGIPFAEPPVADKRWRPPQAVEPWEGLRDVTEFAPAAPQTASPMDPLLGRNVVLNCSENCLQLNVFTPGLDGVKRPVMVWIHGGSFIGGWTGDPMYNPERLAKIGDVVVVTVGYRLGALGFLRLCDATNGVVPATGNEGLLDQKAALEWVRDNITVFGGDRENITLFGESAGAMSVCALLAMPGCDGLFHKAIIQSGSAVAVNTVEEANRIGEFFLRALGVDESGAAQLSDVGPARLLQAQEKVWEAIATEGFSTLPFRPVVDGDVLPDVPQNLLESGVSRHIPLLCGTTADEWQLFAHMAPHLSTLDRDRFLDQARRMLGPDRGPFVYNNYEDYLRTDGEDAEPLRVFTEMMTDLVFRVPATRILESRSPGDARVYRYLFDWPPPIQNKGLGACHAADIGYVFGTFQDGGMDRFFGRGGDSRMVSEAVQRAWTRFARYGAPDVEYEWPAFEPGKRQTMVLGYDAGLRANIWQDVDPTWYRVGTDILRRY